MRSIHQHTITFEALTREAHRKLAQAIRGLEERPEDRDNPLRGVTRDTGARWQPIKEETES